MAGPPRKKKKPDLPENVASLVRALQFVSLVADEEGNPMLTNCRMEGRQIRSTNGVVTLGAPIDDDVSACPHTKRFLSALLKCDGAVQLALLPHAVSIKSGAFRAAVPLVEAAALPDFGPDPLLCPLDDRLRPALAACAPFANESAGRQLLAVVNVKEGVCQATTGTALLEAWHGISLPEMAMSKASVAMLLKIAKPLAGFGYSGKSATFYFDDNSWLKTQLIEFQWPTAQVDKMLAQPSVPVPLPKRFWEACDAIEDFVDNGRGFYIFGDKHVRSEVVPEAGAVYEFDSVGCELAIASDLLDKCRPYMANVDFTTYPDRLLFNCPTARGVLMFGTV